MPTTSISMAPLLALVLCWTFGCAGVAEQNDYQRHSMSDFQEDWAQPGVFVFEASTSPEFPADSESAEMVRMEWLAAWLKRSNHCPAGWEPISREAIPPAEVHPRRRNLRYQVRCSTAAPDQSEARNQNP